MTSHDQLSKSLIRIFFPDFLRLLAPELASRLDPDEATFLDKEGFNDWPAGDRREMDLVAKIPRDRQKLPLLVHVEIETEFRSGMDHRLWEYYMQLRLRHGLLVLPILVNLRGGRPGLRRAALREGAENTATAVFRYRVLGLSGCPAEEWLSKPEPIAWAFAALMRPGSWSWAELKLECLRRVAASGVSGLGKQILVDWIETYVQLSGEDALAFQRLLDQEGNEEIRAMELTWLGQAEARGLERGIETGMQKGIEKGLARGIVQGSEAATREAVERMRRMVLQLVEQRFGAVPARVRQKIEAIDGIEPLAALTERILVVPSVADLALP